MTKLLTSPALSVDRGSAFVAGKPISVENLHKWWFCIDDIRNIFDLPDVKKLWLEFHDKPGNNRCYVKVIEHKSSSTDMIISVDGVLIHVAGHTGRMIANRLKRTSCYVGCKFEAVDV